MNKKSRKIFFSWYFRGFLFNLFTWTTKRILTINENSDEIIKMQYQQEKDKKEDASNQIVIWKNFTILFVYINRVNLTYFEFCVGIFH